MMRSTPVIFFVLSNVCVAADAPTKSHRPLNKLMASDAAPADYFANSVALSGDHAVIGSWLDDDAGPSSGSAYIFYRERNGTDDDLTDDVWIQQAKLTPADGEAGDEFGYSVAIDGDLVVIGAWRAFVERPGAGCVYVYRRDNGGTPSDPSDDRWFEYATLTAGDRPTAYNFGSSVAVSGRHVVVGSVNDFDGAAYLFVLNENGTPEFFGDDNWIEQARLTSCGTAQHYDFGHAVAIDGNHVLVGVYGYALARGWVGAACLFRREDNETPEDLLDDVWREQAFLTPSDVVEGSRFGWSVSLSGEWAIIGAPGYDWSGVRGSVYLFQRDDNSTSDPFDDTWPEVAKLVGTDVYLDDLFGHSVSIDGEFLVVGANYSDTPSLTNCGAAYVFAQEGSSWFELAKLTADDASIGHGFGRSVAISDGTALIAAWGDDNNGLGSGASYVFDVSSRMPGVLTDAVTSPTQRRLNLTQTIDCTVVELVPGGTSNRSRLGSSVSVSGTLAVVGEEGHDSPVLDGGAAYIFEWDGGAWNQRGELTPSVRVIRDYFGSSVSIDGDRVLVASRAGGTTAGRPNGRAFIYRLEADTWTEEAVLVDDHPDTGFANAVALSGNVAVVAAAYDDEACPGWDSAWCNTGAVHVYRKVGNAWNHEAKLTADEVEASDFFGTALALDEDTLLVAGGLTKPEGNGADKVFVFRHDGSNWIQEAKLQSSDRSAFDQFGVSIALEEDRAVIGAWGNDEAGLNAGAAYVFEYDGAAWTERAKLMPYGASPHDGFGYSIAISGGRVAVGAFADDASACEGGAVYVFEEVGSSWLQASRLTPPKPVASGWFGRSVAIDGSLVVVGAPTDPNPIGGAGAAYAYLGIENCPANQAADKCTIPHGDKVLFAYEGDVLPYEEAGGFRSFPPDYAVSESIENGLLTLNWPARLGNFGSQGYHLELEQGPVSTLPPIWIEWRFRAEWPSEPTCFIDCDAMVYIHYKSVADGMAICGDFVSDRAPSGYLTGLEVGRFHTYRFETEDGAHYRMSADGIVFAEGWDCCSSLGHDYLQIHPQNGCWDVRPTEKRDDWDFVRYGIVSRGERVIASDPPGGVLDARAHAGLDRFTVTFNAPNYVHVDEITVEVTGGDGPSVVATRRRENEGVETVEIVLDRPIAMGETTRFVLNDGVAVNVVEYTFVAGDTDGNGLVDLADVAAFQRCFGITKLAGACLALDLDHDDNVNLPDLPELVNVLSGP